MERCETLRERESQKKIRLPSDDEPYPRALIQMSACLDTHRLVLALHRDGITSLFNG